MANVDGFVSGAFMVSGCRAFVSGDPILMSGQGGVGGDYVSGSISEYALSGVSPAFYKSGDTIYTDAVRLGEYIGLGIAGVQLSQPNLLNIGHLSGTVALYAYNGTIEHFAVSGINFEPRTSGTTGPDVTVNQKHVFVSGDPILMSGTGSGYASGDTLYTNDIQIDDNYGIKVSGGYLNINSSGSTIISLISGKAYLPPGTNGTLGVYVGQIGVGEGFSRSNSGLYIWSRSAVKELYMASSIITYVPIIDSSGYKISTAALYGELYTAGATNQWYVSGRYMYMASYSGSYFNWTSGPVAGMLIDATNSGCIIAQASGIYYIETEGTFRGPGYIAAFLNGAAYPSATGRIPAIQGYISAGAEAGKEATIHAAGYVRMVSGDRIDARFWSDNATAGSVDTFNHSLKVHWVGA